MPSKIIDEKLKNEIIKYYMSSPMSLKQVAQEFNLCTPTVGKILKDTPKYTKAKIFNPNLDEHFFNKINNEASAYFLGLLISDGNIFLDKSSNGRQASISITLDSNDEYLLSKLKQCTGTNTVIAHDGRGCSQLAIRSDIMAKELEQYGVVPRKSFSTFLPRNIADKYMSHLIRGIFDGDGSILAKTNFNNKFLHSISFCGTSRLMDDIRKYCFKRLSLNTIPTIYSYSDRELSEIKIQRMKDIYTFGEWLYNDATIFMTRKFDIYNRFKLHYNL